MKPNSYQISAFCLVARHRSFSRAAQALGVTQSSVAQHVGKLERLMEAKLVVRNRDGLALTPAGADLFQLSDRLKTLEEAVYERVSNYQKLEDGYLRNISLATGSSSRERVKSVRATPVAVQLYGVVPQVLPIFLS